MGAIRCDRDWADEQVASGEFGNELRNRRAAAMLRDAVRSPAGKLTNVFKTSAARQAAYKFVEGAVPVESLMDAFGGAAVRAVAHEREPVVVIDGTSLSLTDHSKSKAFGAIGAGRFPTRGLKVITCLALDDGGVPAGLADLEWWARRGRRDPSRARRRAQGATEMSHWLAAIERVRGRFSEAVAPCIVIDREGDCAQILKAVAKDGGKFVVRMAQRKRPVRRADGRDLPLATHMKRQRILGYRHVDVPAGPNRAARRSLFEVRASRVELDLPDHATRKRFTINAYVVWAREQQAPRGEKRLDWMLFTDREVDGLCVACEVLERYCRRWRIEEFHRVWKRGGCNVEETQLRRKEHVVRWATMLALVSVRIEQLKRLARTEPDSPALVAFTEQHVRALKAMRIQYGPRNAVIPEQPTIQQAVVWIAELGGYTGKSSGGPPGSVTLGRGLDRFEIWAEAFGVAEKLYEKRG